MTAYARRKRDRVIRELDYQQWLKTVYVPPFLIGQLSSNRDSWWTRREYAARSRAGLLKRGRA